jgi:hypothetical protein
LVTSARAASSSAVTRNSLVNMKRSVAPKSVLQSLAGGLGPATFEAWRGCPGSMLKGYLWTMGLFLWFERDRSVSDLRAPKS